MSPFKVQELPPEAELRTYIKRWIYFEYKSGQAHINQVAPTGTIFIRHSFNDVFPKIIKEDKVISNYQPTAFVGHPIKGDIRVSYQGHIKQVLVEFTPLGFYKLFKFSVDKLQNAEADVSHFGHGPLAQLLVGLDDPERIHHIIKHYLIGLSRDPANVPESVAQLVSVLQEPDLRSYAEVAGKQSKKDAKRIYRLFRKCVGLSPKQFQRIQQLNHLIYLINTENFDSLSDLANRAGYYDQADFIRHVKTHLKQKPSDLVGSRTQALFHFMGAKKK